jgi:hypothetical protein
MQGATGQFYEPGLASWYGREAADLMCKKERRDVCIKTKMQVFGGGSGELVGLISIVSLLVSFGYSILVRAHT